jgi:nitroreductase
MDVFDVVRTVLAVREFAEKPVRPEAIRKIAESAWLTGSSMNRQPWKFIVIEDPKMLDQFGRLARYGPYIAGAAFAVVVVIEKTSFAVSDASRAIQSMILTAWSEGVGSNWVGFFGLDDVKPLLGIPEELDILAIVPFGYPVGKIGLGKKKRKLFGEVVFRGTYGGEFK